MRCVQAANELDPEYWTLMKDRLPETVSIEDWLCKTLKSGDRVHTRRCVHAASCFTISVMIIHGTRMEGEFLKPLGFRE